MSSPVLVMVLEGWIDSGFSAGSAIQTLLSGLDTYPVASFDADALLDHRARRPIMKLVDGVNTSLAWPGIELRAAMDLDGRDILLLVGAEPDHSWRTFSTDVLELAKTFGVRLVVGLGAYPATVPHTRPVVLSVTASTPELAAVSGLLRGTLDVPAGVQAVIEGRSVEYDMPALGLWAQVPHYVSGEVTPYPAAALALLDQLERTASLRLPKGDLAEAASRARNRIDAAMGGNDEHLAMLHELERRHDEVQSAPPAGPDPGDQHIPSADELAAEVERFLRDQGGS